MQRHVSFIALVASFGLLLQVGGQTSVGFHFSFQSGPATPAAETFTDAVSASTFPGSPSVSRTGSPGAINTAFDNFGSNFTAFDGTVWLPGKCATWNAGASGGSTGNTVQITFSTTAVNDLTVRFKYRLNGVKSSGSTVNAFTAFDYRIGGGAFQTVPGASLALANNTNYNNAWTADLSSLTAIENQSSVTLRWSLPDFDQIANTQLRIDDLQVTGSSSASPPRTRYLPTGSYNVLFVAFDDLKANFGPFITPELAAAMPRPVTPNLDSLSSAGMAFTRAYCQQPVCWASRVSLLTGCRPDTTKVWDDGPNFRATMPGVISLPQHFANVGYSVAGYGKIFDSRSTPAGQDAALSWPDGQSDPGVSHTNSGSAHNFYEDGHWQVEQAAPTGASNRQPLFATDAGITNFWVTPNRPVNPDTDYGDGIIATAAINKLNTFASAYQNNGTRFFLAVGFKKPHLPFVSPKTFWDLYDPDEIDLAGYTGTRTMPSGTLPFTAATYEIGSYKDLNGANPVSPPDARRLIHGYLAATSFADYQLGRVIAALEAAGVADNTIIIVWGDHGWHLGDHNGFWAKHSCYENAARAPLIISAPGMAALGTAGNACKSPVEFVDIFPTLVDLANIAEPLQPTGFESQGTSLRPLLEDPHQPWKKGAFSQYQRNINGSGVARPGNGMGYTVRTDRYRYTEWWRTQSTIDANGDSLTRDVKLFSTPEHVELYDYFTDPNETVNLAGNPAHAALVAELSAMLAGGNGWTSASVDAPVTYPVTYDTWRSSHAIPGIDPLVDLAGDADPDGDGIRNLLEYKTGRHPLIADRDSILSGIEKDTGTDYFSMYFDSVLSRTDISLVAERSSSLLPGSFQQTNITTTVLSTLAGKQQKRSRVQVSPGADFMRLNAH
jgi:arylsulfatase A-like enzyme